MPASGAPQRGFGRIGWRRGGKARHYPQGVMPPVGSRGTQTARGKVTNRSFGGPLPEGYEGGVVINPQPPFNGGGETEPGE